MPGSPIPPFAAIRALVAEFLGPVPCAGQGVLRHGSPDGEAIVLRAAGIRRCSGPANPEAGVMQRSADDIVAWVYSLSGSAPHLFGERREAFERELRGIMHRASPGGWFSEQPPDTEVFIWRKPKL